MMRVIGLISGTSVDGIDAALVEISGTTVDLRVNLIAAQTHCYPPALRETILAVCAGAALPMAELAALDDAIAHHFAQAALSLQQGHPAADLIGSHGQTVFHRPPDAQAGAAVPLGYSLQLGRGDAIAHLTGITTVSNFRAADIAMGGQGAPMVPPVDRYLLGHPTYHRCIQNIGGIGNVAFIPASQEPVLVALAAASTEGLPLSTHPAPLPTAPFIRGWDTGPGNALLDLAVHQLSGGTKTYDENGAWAAQGTPWEPLVQRWLQQPFFQQQPPKSTGRELFGVEYLQQCLNDAEPLGLSEADFLATLTELTAASIVHSYQQFLPHMPDQVLLCGGGSRNLYLKSRLQARLGSVSVLTTDEVGLNADFKEAIAFAVLGYWRISGIPGNFPDVTGARNSVLLGEIHLATHRASDTIGCR